MKKIVFIVGSWRSGSTVLGKSLGSHSGGLFVGEMQRLRDQYNSSAHCSCEVPYRHCLFWNDILNRLKNSNMHRVNGIPDLEVKSKRDNRLTGTWLLVKFLFSSLFSLPYRDKANGEAIENTIRIYDEIFKKTDAQFIVDSGKGFSRALMIALNAPHYGVTTIHLIRNGKGVLQSTQKEKVKIHFRDKVVEAKVETQAPKRVIKGWLAVNLRILILSRLLIKKRERVLVRYEDFAASPRETLQKLSQFLGIQYEDNMLKLDHKIHHIVGGNASRINAKRIHAPARDGDSELNEAMLKQFHKKAGWFNRVLGYR
jgi:hypothetical protein